MKLLKRQVHYVCLYEYRWYVDCPRLISAASLLGLHSLSMYSLHFVCLLLNIPSQQLLSLRDGQFT